MKNKGSLLLELGVSIFVILIVITMAFSINKMILNSTKKKINTYEMEESLHSIINEVKYNIKYEYLKELLKDKELTFKYNNDFLKNIRTTNLLDMNVGKGSENIIKIEKILESKEEEYMELRITIKYEKSNIEGKVIKSYWMDYA
ncbi:hypothetical protein [uncultured Clostridium sp.]|uniref:hypothetical protein n=1 Tax=uncultured Clostridium sp. TaxID=59620 RepID=UPI0025E0D86D|nr:hypothetical protein [uncultured Clostridium sp.]